MSLRRSVALAAGVLLLGTPALTSCGFDYPTDRVNTITNGATDRDNTVYVLNAVVVSSRPGTGTVIATLSNTNNPEPARLTSFSASKDAPLEATEEVDIGLLPDASVNLASSPQIRVSGDFKAGEFITLSFGFDNGEEVNVKAPVVTDCDEYDGLDLSPALASSEGTEAAPEYECGPPVSGEGVDAETDSSEEAPGEESGDSEVAE